MTTTFCPYCLSHVCTGRHETKRLTLAAVMLREALRAAGENVEGCTWEYETFSVDKRVRITIEVPDA